MENLKLLTKQAQKEVARAQDLKELDDLFKRYLGKKGKLTKILRSLKDLPEKKRREKGRLANLVKKNIESAIEKKRYKMQDAPVPEQSSVRGAAKYGIQEEWVDITAPGKKPHLGHLHPLTQVQRRVEEIFQSMGFSAIEGPEVETEWYNFDALNIPKDHPARDAWNTLWIKNKKLLLRTHTSPVQVRYMEKNNPPLRVIVPGRVFRHEATDASHEMNFYQVEGLMIDKEVSAANFKSIIQEFLRRFFSGSAEASRGGGQKSVSIRMRPSYFPFTEPSFEVDMSCLNCGGKGCPSCSFSGWMEMMGAGMVHPNVYKTAGLNPKDWQGFAFGMGLDRLAMMKYKINDVRLFYSGDLRFLNQF